MMSFRQRVEGNNRCIEEQSNNKFTFVLREPSRKAALKLGPKRNPELHQVKIMIFVSCKPVYKIRIDPINPYRPVA